MEFLAGYGEENENSSPGVADKKTERGKETTNSSGNLQAEWESFEKMICGGETTAGVSSSDSSSYLPDGIVAYPSFGKSRQRSNTESSAEQKSANNVKSAEAMQFSFEEVQNISLPPEVPQVSRSRSASISSRSSSPSSKSRSSSASSSVHSDDSDHAVDKDKKLHRLSTESKEEKIPTPPKASKRRASRSSTSPTKRKRSKSRSKSRSPSRKRRSRSRSHSRRKKSRRSHGRRHRSSSRSRRHRRRRSKQRSRSRDRRRRKHRHSSRDRHSRSRSREQRRKRRSSRSRSKDRRKRGHRRTRSRSRSKGRGRHSRSRSRSRSHERISRIASVSSYSSHTVSKDKTLTFKEQMRQQLLKASKFLQNGEHAEGDQPLELPKEKSSNLRLNQTSILSAMAASVSSRASGVTPQMALLQTMAAMHQKAQEMTGVSVPKYYNPAAVNPLKYAEQVQKRKLLWSKNKDKNTVTDKDKDKEKEWQATSFVSDSDGKMAAKFRKLMGMKEGEEIPEEDEETPKLSEEQQKKQQELFSRLDREYEFARMTTHTHRGVGLGFTSQGTYPNT